MMAGSLALLALIFADYRLNLLFFSSNAKSSTSPVCNVVRELRALESALDSQQNKEIVPRLNKLDMQLRIALVIETRSSAPGSDAEPKKDSELASILRSSQSKFEKLAAGSKNKVNFAKVRRLSGTSLKVLEGYC